MSPEAIKIKCESFDAGTSGHRRPGLEVIEGGGRPDISPDPDPDIKALRDDPAKMRALAQIRAGHKNPFRLDYPISHQDQLRRLPDKDKVIEVITFRPGQIK